MNHNRVQLMETNLLKVWNERDSRQRRIAIEGIYTQDSTFFEADKSASGYDAINAKIEETLTSIPGDFIFHIINPATENHNVGLLSWGLGPPNGPTAVTGTDIAIFSGYRIQSFYVFLHQKTS
jgi:hypothetical protein